MEGFELEAESIEELVQKLDEALEQHGRITLPGKGQKLAAQSSTQADPWPTLHRALPLTLPDGITWEKVVDEFVDRMGINRYDLIPNSGDAHIIEAWECPILPAPIASLGAASAVGGSAVGGGASSSAAGGSGEREGSPRPSKKGTTRS